MFCHKSGWTWVGAVVVLGLTGCAGTPGETVDEKAQGIGEECGSGSATATATFFEGISVTSPQTYDVSHCYKGQIYDVQTYDGNLGATAGTLSTLVQWADARPAASDCASAWVGSDLFVGPSGSSNWHYIGSQGANGVVVNGKCFVPSVLWTTQMPPSNSSTSYRVTATARTFNGTSAPTRKVLTQTLVDGVVDNCLNKPVNDANGCTIDSCSPATGVVGHQPLSDGAACCGGTCAMGVCVPAMVVAGASGVCLP